MTGSTVRRFTGVYNASGGLFGELRYIAGKLRGTAHCELCDLTHSGLRHRRSWSEFVATLDVPFDLIHRNERSAELERVSGVGTPCVVAHTDDGLVVVFSPDDFTRLDPGVDAFATALGNRLHDLDLHLPDERP